jgi:hypothetical protein
MDRCAARSGADSRRRDQRWTLIRLGLAAADQFEMTKMETHTMTNQSQKKGPWMHRFLMNLFTGIFALLAYWLLGFVVSDIGTWPGPVYSELESRRLDPEIVTLSEEQEGQIAEIERSIRDQKARQELLSDSTANSQRTMDQLLDFQRSSLEKNVAPSAEEKQALAESQRRFLANQSQYQLLNEEIVQLNERLRQLQQEQRETEGRLETLRRPIREEFDGLQRSHRLRVAALKLAVLLPLLGAGLFLFLKRRGGPYAPIIYAFGAAVLLRVGVVMHEYFPSRVFRYILILSAIAIVLQILLYLVRLVLRPKRDWLLKQYREAYEVFLCPMCAYPIRRGPLKYALWTRRSVRMLVPQDSASDSAEEPYTCPMCSTRLYEECENCHALRHSLLPSCQHCGQLRAVAA